MTENKSAHTQYGIPSNFPFGKLPICVKNAGFLMKSCKSIQNKKHYYATLKGKMSLLSSRF